MTDPINNDIKNDELLQHFLKENFDEKQFATQIVQAQTVSDFLSKIANKIDSLETQLHHHVIDHHNDLLSQAVGIDKLESVLDMMQSRTSTLTNAMNKVRQRVKEPHAALMARVSQLERMQTTCELLRKIARITYLTRRLQTHSKDIAKSSACINELEYLFDSVDWDGIQVLETCRRTTKQTREDLEAQAWALLWPAFETNNQSQLGLGLQVFFNLSILDRVVVKLMKDWQADFERSLTAAVDVELITQRSMSRAHALGANPGVAMPMGPGRAALPSGGQAAAFHAALWTSLDRLVDQLLICYTRVRLLQRILARKRDANQQRRLADCLVDGLVDPEGGKLSGPERDLVLMALAGEDSDLDEVRLISPSSPNNFLTWASDRLADTLTSCAERTTFIKDALEGEYPKLLKLFFDLGRKLSEAEGVATLAPSLVIPCPFWRFLTPFETAYLSRSLSRLFDRVELAFGGSGHPPSADEVDSMVQTAASELTFATVNPELLTKVARNVAKMVALFATKIEHVVCTGGESSQVVGPITTGQQLNIHLVNLIHAFRSGMEAVAGIQLRLPLGPMGVIREALEQPLNSLIKNTLGPLLNSIGEALEEILTTMHREDFGGVATSVPSGKCSLYMQELQEFVVRVKAQYLIGFRSDDILSTCITPHLVRTIDLFLIHASLLRPLSESGKLRLVADCAQLELALAPFHPARCEAGDALGMAHRRLRALRPLVFQSTEGIVASIKEGGSSSPLPLSLVLHHLFSRAPPDLPSPHTSASWSVIRYTQWTLDHTAEQDRLQFIRGALDAYAKSVVNRGQREYASIYPLMLQLVQK